MSFTKTTPWDKYGPTSEPEPETGIKTEMAIDIMENGECALSFLLNGKEVASSFMKVVEAERFALAIFRRIYGPTPNEFKKEVMNEWSCTDKTAARSSGRQGGRPKGLSKTNETKSHAAASLYNERKLTVQQICEQLNISKATLYRYLRSRGVQIGT